MEQKRTYGILQQPVRRCLDDSSAPTRLGVTNRRADVFLLQWKRKKIKIVHSVVANFPSVYSESKCTGSTNLNFVRKTIEILYLASLL